MRFKRMPLEVWFNKYQYEIEYDIGESAIGFRFLGDLGVNLENIPLRYGFHKGKPELRELIAKEYHNVASNQVLVTNGAAEALFDVAATLLNPGDHVIVEHPNYASNYEVPRSLGCEVDLLRLRFSEDFKPDIKELERLIRPETKLVSLTHPNNPTGSMISEQVLKEIVKLIENHNAYLLFDETYRELHLGHKLPTGASLHPKVISVSSMSKTYGLPGVRIGWVASQDKSLIESILATREQVTICNSAISEFIALKILSRKEDILEDIRNHVEENLREVSKWIKNQQKLEWAKPEAGVVAFPRIKPHLSNTYLVENVYRLLIEKYDTFVIPGHCFEMEDEFFRLGFGGELGELKAGLENLGAVLRNL